MNRKNEKYYLTEDELEVFETSFQYGNLKNANYVFVGMEEGLGRFGYQENLEGRLNFLTKHNHYVHYIDAEQDYRNGWYVTDIEDSPALLTAINSSLENRGIPISWEVDRKIYPTMRMQIRLAKLLETNMDFSTLDLFQSNTDYSSYPLHTKDGATAMFDWYPLPKRSKNDFPYIVSGKFDDLKSYYHYYDTQDTTRINIIKNMYDTLPLNISFVYVGIQRGKFKLQKHFEDVLGFQFAPYNTGLVPASFSTRMDPSQKPKPFSIGQRIRDDGHRQLAVMTPFWGMGQFGFDDINAMAAWVYEKQSQFNLA